MALQFKVGNGEFGEVYHLLATSYLLREVDKEIAVCFENFPAGEELFRFLSIKTAQYNPDLSPQPLPSTANLLFQYFYPGCLDRLAKTIVETAQAQGWLFPSPELATTQTPSSLFGNVARHTSHIATVPEGCWNSLSSSALTMLHFL